MAEIISALVGLVAGFLGGIWQSWLAKRNKIDDSLFDTRKLLYVELWKMTGKIPKYPRDDKLSSNDAYELMIKLRDWYFDKQGGLYMSADTQKRYLAFQAALDSASKFAGDNAVEWANLYNNAQARGSALRTGMTRDLHSRSAARIF